MDANVGSADRVVRFIAGALLVALPFLLSGGVWDLTATKVLMPVVGAILIGTAFMRFCPLYRLVGLRTCKAPQ